MDKNTMGKLVKKATDIFVEECNSFWPDLDDEEKIACLSAHIVHCLQGLSKQTVARMLCLKFAADRLGFPCQLVDHTGNTNYIS